MTVPVPQPSDLLATIAHEFRTPLSAMQITLELLRDFGSLPPEEAAQLVRRLQRSVNWLVGLIGNLEIWAAVENGRLAVDWAPVSVRECADLAVSLVQPILDRHRQRMRVVCPASSPVVWGESRLLCQVLVNLLTNASQYSQPADEINLEISRQSGWVEIRVADHGQGIAEHEQSMIFERYARGNTPTRRADGLGLGLHIVKTVVELHGGQVGVDSIPAQGASFWLRLPQLTKLDEDRGNRMVD